LPICRASRPRACCSRGWGRKSFHRQELAQGLGGRGGRPWRARASPVAPWHRPPEAKQLDDYYFGRAVANSPARRCDRVNDLKTGKKAPAPALAKVLAGPVRKAAAASAAWHTRGGGGRRPGAA